LIEYIQNLRVEEAKRLLEANDNWAEDIASDVEYDNIAFFRRLFKRSTGLTTGENRRLFRPFAVKEPSAAR
jgi:YesN/AraC family two-component response regulator